MLLAVAHTARQLRDGIFLIAARPIIDRQPKTHDSRLPFAWSKIPESSEETHWHTRFRSLSPQSNRPCRSTQRWPLAQRVIFRFLCAYLVLYALPDSGRLSIFSFIPSVESLYTSCGTTLCPWVAIRFFHVTGQPATYFRTGSGDTTLAYIQNLLFVVSALVIALAWSVLDRKRPNYATLHAWLRLMVRYTVAFTLFSYGLGKVFPLQFRTPNLLRLLEPYGDFSPMGALWWFMGASTAYIIFSGVCEVLGGLLLVFRRTATLGALVSFAVLLNVMVLNYCYDVPGETLLHESRVDGGPSSPRPISAVCSTSSSSIARRRPPT